MKRRVEKQCNHRVVAWLDTGDLLRDGRDLSNRQGLRCLFVDGHPGLHMVEPQGYVYAEETVKPTTSQLWWGDNGELDFEVRDLAQTITFDDVR